MFKVGDFLKKKGSNNHSESIYVVLAIKKDEIGVFWMVTNDIRGVRYFDQGFNEYDAVTIETLYFKEAHRLQTATNEDLSKSAFYQKCQAYLRGRAMKQLDKTHPVKLNREIERFIQDMDSQGKKFSPLEIEYIKQYSGYGGTQAEDTNSGVLTEYYTSKEVVGLMWELAVHYGYQGGKVLEPSCGTGVFMWDAPEGSQFVGFEPNLTACRIAQVAAPTASVHNLYFEQAFLATPRFTRRIKERVLESWLGYRPFDLAIGNPPYGYWKNTYSPYFMDYKWLAQLEAFFIYASLSLVKKGGLLVFIVNTNLMSTGLVKYKRFKQELSGLAQLLDAYRLPNVFERTQISTDIIVLKKL